MGTEEVVKVVAWNGQKSSTGEVRIFHWNSRERLMRGGKALALCWGLAIASIFIPVLHFVLVPAFLLIGPFLFYINYKQETGVLGGEVPCPLCQNSVKINSGPVRWPIFDICEQCKASVRLEKA